MNYLIQMWRMFWCKHSFHYVMRISSQGRTFNCLECSRCFAMTYEQVSEEDVNDNPFKDLGSGHGG